MKTIKEVDEYCRLHNKVLTCRARGLWIVDDKVKEGGKLVTDDYSVKRGGEICR